MTPRLALCILLGCAAPTAPVPGGLLENESPDPAIDTTTTPPQDSTAPRDTVPEREPPDPPEPPSADQPRLLWTPARQAAWNTMVFERHPAARIVQQNCERARSGSPRYGDRGLWCTIWYRWSGDLAAARTAWAQVAPELTAPPTNANEVREEFLEHAIIFDWLRAALSDDEVAAGVEGLNGWARYALAIGTPQYVGGIRLADSDALVGYYFGLAATDLATRGLPGHQPWLDAVQQSPGPVPVGGLDPGSGNSARTALHRLLTGPGQGGVWVESSEYNLGTIALLALGVEAVRTAAGPQHFAEAESFLRDAARVQLANVTADLRHALQWGDNEHPRGFRDRLFRRRTLLGVLAGAIAGTEEAGRLHDLSRELAQRYGETGYGSAEAWPRMYLLFDPTAPAYSWHRDGESWYASGMGMAWVRLDQDLFWMAMTPWLGVDHEVQYLADFQLYRQGEWVLTRPMGYSGPAVEVESANSLVLSGLGAMASRGPVRFEQGTDWWALTGESHGPRYGAGYYDPPPSFVDQWQRTVVYLRRAGRDHLVVVDWVDMRDPVGLGKLDRYRSNHRSGIENRRGLVEWLIHTPQPATRNGNQWLWNTPQGQPVAVTSLGIGQVEGVVIDETSLWGGAWNFRASELAWQLRIVPAFGGGTITLRHVVSVGEGSEVPVLEGEAIRIGATRIEVTATGVAVTN
jgi:hypothetical protein